MTQKPGKYVDVCEMAREAAQAGGAVLLILDGNHGSGITSTFTDYAAVDAVPKMLREAADKIEAWNNKGEEAIPN